MDASSFFSVASPLNMQYESIERHLGYVRPRTRNRVCIIGAAGQYREPTPWYDDRYEIWCCNALWRRAVAPNKEFRADRWFELHPETVQSETDLAWLKECPLPVYTLGDAAEWVPNYVTYPIERVVPLGRRYFTNTFAYQVALAILEGFHTIKLCNIWLESGRERVVERACLEFWIGIALGRGIVVDIPESSPLTTQPYLYGYDYWPEKQWVERMLRDKLCSFAEDGYRGSK